MKAFVAGVALSALIAVGAWFVLSQEMDFSAATVYQSHSDSVRLSPGMGQRPGE